MMDKEPDELTPTESDLAVNFYDAGCDYPVESFKEIVRRVLGDTGFAKHPPSAAFERECRRMFDLAHTKE
ncbi:MAG TPA: hypothetical protein VGD60_20370 [Candidatus Acidoferrales bacterium]